MSFDSQAVRLQHLALVYSPRKWNSEFRNVHTQTTRDLAISDSTVLSECHPLELNVRKTYSPFIEVRHKNI